MKKNVFENIIIDKNKEQFFDLLKNDKIKIEKIVSNGQSSPINFWYEQEKNEFVLILKGNAIIEYEHSDIELKEGDYINIKAFTKHRVKYTNKDEPTIWLAVFY
ncbi:MAG: cupin [Arcobacter sp.]|jgi:cupin 2 domain-containing protein|uniref:cupin domain-containing protein n=1 Tax=Poseidonibacter ostreae TaxID=2654171 RepID=UPI000C990019|nr:cupin domain-containing protein [Poseidonibacter ostreae]KAB7884206.1 cupin domain-containing protein [Poseidonibacter ostreae]MAC83085.1 cupin [Arcobacter sp.]|tara:strand:+ start:447 stop:758 length:312 start_codon:yes stop_codon:yes gene_type:complete